MGRHVGAGTKERQTKTLGCSTRVSFERVSFKVRRTNHEFGVVIDWYWVFEVCGSFVCSLFNDDEHDQLDHTKVVLDNRVSGGTHNEGG